MSQYRKSLFATLLFSQSVMIFAQGPVGNTIYVTLDHTTMVGSRTLPPGDYTIREVTSASNPRVLEFTTNRGTKLVTTVTAIPLLQNTPPSSTKIVLDPESRELRVSKIWVQGKDYGYEFPKEFGPGQSADAAEMQLRYEVPTTAAAAGNSVESQPARTTVAQGQPRQDAQVQETPSQQAQPRPTEVTQAQPQTAPRQDAEVQETPAQQTTPRATAELDQAQPQPAPRQDAQVQETPAPPATPRPTQEVAQAQSQQTPAQGTQAPNAPARAADQDQSSTDVVVPATGLGWANFLLFGIVSLAAGLFLLKRTV